MGDLSKDFSRWEFACNCGCGFDTVDIETLEVVQEIRDHFNARVSVSSGCRCRYWNAHEGGAPDSLHVHARAADISVVGVHPDKVADYLEAKYPDRYGIGRYNTFTHIDTRSGHTARWDKRTSV